LVKASVLLIVLTIVFIATVAAAIIVDRGFGSIDVETVRISNGDHELSGLLYRPREASSSRRLPAVMLIHGISSSKESMSSIALELARNGFVALTIDAVGHGDSGGRLWATGFKPRRLLCVKVSRSPALRGCFLTSCCGA
jgi:fermentation-respiration switch protein FrsA (DUF1100 family)